MGISDWLAIASLLISGVALFRPEMEKALTKFVGGVKFYPPGEIQVGYTGFGPTITFTTVLSSGYGTVFLHDMSLVVTKLSDRSIHRLPWKVFRKLNYLDLSKSELEPAAAITLTDAATHKLNILFSDQDAVARLNPLAEALQADMFARAKEKWKTVPEKDSGEFQRFSEAYRSNKGAEISAFVMGLAREFYWESGSYALDIQFFISGRLKPIKYSYAFSLTSEDERNLRSSYPVIVEGVTAKKMVVFPEAQCKLVAK